MNRNPFIGCAILNTVFNVCSFAYACTLCNVASLLTICSSLPEGIKSMCGSYSHFRWSIRYFFVSTLFPCSTFTSDTTALRTPLRLPITSRGDCFFRPHQSLSFVISNANNFGGSPLKRTKPVIVPPFFTSVALYGVPADSCIVTTPSDARMMRQRIRKATFSITTSLMIAPVAMLLVFTHRWRYRFMHRILDWRKRLEKREDCFQICIV